LHGCGLLGFEVFLSHGFVSPHLGLIYSEVTILF